MVQGDGRSAVETTATVRFSLGTTVQEISEVELALRPHLRPGWMRTLIKVTNAPDAGSLNITWRDEELAGP